MKCAASAASRQTTHFSGSDRSRQRRCCRRRLLGCASARWRKVGRLPVFQQPSPPPASARELVIALPARLAGVLPLPRNVSRPISSHEPRGCMDGRRSLKDLAHSSPPSTPGIWAWTTTATTPGPADPSTPCRAEPRLRRRGDAMGKRSGGRKLPFFSRSSSSSSSKRNRSARRLPSLPKQDNATRALLASPAAASPSPTPAGQAAQPPPPLSVAAATGGAVSGKVGKKKPGARLWMRLDRWGASEVVELDKASIIRRAGVPSRDLRILGPVFSHSSSILAREKAMVINLEFIRAIVTAEEVLLLDPIVKEVLPFVDQLRQHVPLKSLVGGNGDGNGVKQDGSPGGQAPCLNEATGAEHELPFEFQVLEVALEVVCSTFDLSVADLERHATPVLDELTKNVSTRNLERVRSLKSDLTRLLARVQKVRDEIEHLLDDNEDMEHLYLTRKQVQNQQVEALMSSAASNSIVPAGTGVPRLNTSFRHSLSIATSMHLDNDVEDLEMLLEAYFMQLDGIRNRILSVREYIDDTEDYVNIQLDNQRNELIQLQLILTIASFGIAANTYIAGAFAMNIPSSLYEITDGSFFWPFVGGTSSGCFAIFILLLGYAWWKKLLGH